MKKLSLLLSLLFITFSVSSQQILFEKLRCVNVTSTIDTPVTEVLKAFPSAIGAGAYTTGGRGQSVYHVTNLNDSGAGSLRDAVSQPNRTIVFDVSGVINLTSILQFQNNTTIAGQTAPEGGITIDGSRIYTSSSIDNVIVRYIRFRGGIDDTDIFVGGATSNQIALGATNVVFDHCSFSFGGEQAMSMYGGQTYLSVYDNITVQRCFYAESKKGSLFGASYDPRDDETPTGLPVSTPQKSYSFISNAFYNTRYRVPNITGDNSDVDVINNVVYGIKVGGRLSQISGEIRLNHINNYFDYRSQTGDTRVHLIRDDFPPEYIYTSGNKYLTTGTSDPLIITETTMNADNRQAYRWFVGDRWGEYIGDEYFTTTQKPLEGKSFTILTADETFTEVTSDVGANARLNADGTVSDGRDVLDTEWLRRILADESVAALDINPTAMAVPPIPSVSRPQQGFYVSNAHIPEAYLTARGITGNANIHNQVQPSGYTLLEEYLNQVDAGYVPTLPVAVTG